jgi:hypothetical protein
MLFAEVIYILCETHWKAISTPREQTAGIFNVKGMVHIFTTMYYGMNPKLPINIGFRMLQLRCKFVHTKILKYFLCDFIFL